MWRRGRDLSDPVSWLLHCVSFSLFLLFFPNQVVLARELATSREYAIKILEKRHIIKENKVPYVTRERDVMSRLDHPFFVKLYFTFQDDEKLCILCVVGAV